jgi:pectinesterase
LGTRTLSYGSDAWDPTGEIEDVNKIVPGLVVDPNGDPEVDGTYVTIQSAISAAVVVAGCPRVFIQVMPGTYREKITVPAKTSSPPVTLYGKDRDPSKVVIVRGDSSAGAEGTDPPIPLTIQQSATFSNSLPQPFQARNLTIANDYVAGTFPGDEEQQTAVALLTQADQALFDNVRILGHRNALYVKSTGANEVARAYFRNCYIEGDEDIILGRGAAVIDQSRIHSLGDRVSSGAITAPSTRVDNPHGVLIINSELTADSRVSGVYLGRQWYEGEEEEAVGKAIIRNSILGAHIRMGDAWARVPRATLRNPTPTPVVLYDSDDYYRTGAGLIPPEVFLAEFGNAGPGAAP